MGKQEQEGLATARQQGDRMTVRTTDAADLPQGAWIGQSDGKLYRCIAGHSLVSVISKDRQNFIRLSDNGYADDDQLRVLAARAGVTPEF